MNKKVPRRPTTVTRPELMPDGTDAEFRTMMHDLLSFTQIIHENRANFASMLGISDVQYTVLTAVAYLQADDLTVAVVDVARHLHVTASFVTMETNKLAQKKLISKEPDLNDKRRVNIRLSEEGWRLLGSLVPIQRPSNDMFFDGISVQDFCHLRRLFSVLAKNAVRSKALLAYLKSTYTISR